MLLALPMVFIIGVLSRIADMIADDGLRLSRYAGYAIGALYGFLIAYLVTQFPILAELGVAILLSVLITGKIEHPVHYLGIASLLFFMAVFGIGPLNIALLLVFVLGAALDEAGNLMADKGKIRGAPGAFFRFRLTMEALTLTVSVYTGNVMFFLAMVAYDAGFTYVFPDRIRRKLISVSG
jgi:hypothetical protein